MTEIVYSVKNVSKDSEGNVVSGDISTVGTTIAYDGQGNISTITQTDSAGGVYVTTMTYDGSNRVISIGMPVKQ